jgi:hypothetical protein
MLIPNHFVIPLVRSTSNKTVIIGSQENSGYPSGIGDANGRDELDELVFDTHDDYSLIKLCIFKSNGSGSLSCILGRGN